MQFRKVLSELVRTSSFCESCCIIGCYHSNSLSLLAVSTKASGPRNALCKTVCDIGMQLTRVCALLAYCMQGMQQEDNALQIMHDNNITAQQSTTFHWGCECWSTVGAKHTTRTRPYDLPHIAKCPTVAAGWPEAAQGSEQGSILGTSWTCWACASMAKYSDGPACTAQHQSIQQSHDIRLNAMRLQKTAGSSVICQCAVTYWDGGR